MAEGTEKNPGNGKTVFIVEDDVFLVKVYQVRFKDEGVEVLVATDGKEALAFLNREKPPAVVLLDLMLPGMSGFDVLSAIRKDERWKKVPVLVLTNLGQPQDEERARALGVEDYVVKANVKIGDIVEKVKKYL